MSSAGGSSSSPGVAVCATPPRGRGDAIAAAVARLPSPVAVGNAHADADAAIKFNLLKSMITECLQDQGPILKMFDAMTEYRKMEQNVRNDAEAHEQFDGVVTVYHADESFLISVLAVTSELSLQTIKKMLKCKSDQLQEMVEAETQMGHGVKLAGAMQIKEVAQKVLVKRSSELGGFLKKRVAEGAISEQGLFNWRDYGVYKLVIEGNILKTIEFWANDSIDVNLPMTDGQAKIFYNFSYWRAELVCPPLPPTKVHTFFANQKLGPHRFKEVTSRSGTLTRMVNAAYQEWTDDKNKATSTATAMKVAQEVCVEVSSAEKEKKRKSLEVAREKGKAAMKKKREASASVFEPTAGQ